MGGRDFKRIGENCIPEWLICEYTDLISVLNIFPGSTLVKIFSFVRVEPRNKASMQLILDSP